MNNKVKALAQTMALLMHTTPQTTLGKLLNFCLAAKVDDDQAQNTALELANDLMEHPDHLSRWLEQVMESDNDITVDEMVALSEMHLKNPQSFMDQLFKELEALDL